MTVYLGNRRIDLMQVGRAHVAGDIVIHVSNQNVMFTGDIVQAHSAWYCGDGPFGDQGGTLGRIRAFGLDAPAARVAARNGSVKDAYDAGRAECDPKFRDWAIYEHCLPFNVSRACDEARGIDHPRHLDRAARSGPLGDVAKLNDAQSSALNARLILILMNHLGDDRLMAAALRLAKQ